MSRVYGEQVEVQTREDGRPRTFAWRERLYAVVAVLEHWMVNGDGWRAPAPVPVRPELEFWRVEASTTSGHRPGGRPPTPGTTGVYELRRDVAVGTWTLRRIAD
jgi:hypothetical protein